MRIGIVLVTFNRLDDLRKTLQAYEGQTLKPEFVLVVDNHSTDGTDGYLCQWREKVSSIQHIAVILEENMGGSGGFHTGMAEALKQSCDWIFAADDDAIPKADMLEQLAAFAHTHEKEMKNTAALCTSVNNQGHCSGGHRCWIRGGIFGYFEKFVPEEEYAKEFFEIDTYSFVGSMIRRKALEKAGLPRKDFFIYHDDVEHALRIKKTGKILCVPSAVMYHVDNVNVHMKKANWREYYVTRNSVITHLEHFGLYAGVMRAIRRIAAGMLSFNLQKMQLIWTAILDGFHGRCGIHAVYKPGWEPDR